MKNVFLPLQLLFIFLFQVSLIPAQIQHKIDSLEKILPKANDAERSLILLKLTVGYSKINNSKAKEYLGQCLDELNAHPNDSLKAKALNIGCLLYRNSGEYKKAKEYGETAIAFAKQRGDSLWMANCMNSYANIFLDEGNYPKAAEIYFEVAAIYEALKKPDKLATCMMGISNTYFMQKQFTKAIDSYSATYKMWEKQGDKEQMANALSGIGSCYMQQRQPDKAMPYAKKALELALADGDLNTIALMYMNLGSNYGTAGDMSSCIANFKKAAEINLKMGDKFSTSQTLNNVGVAYFMMKDYKNAETYFLEARKIASSINAITQVLKSCNDLAELYQVTGQFEKANDQLIRYIKLNDSVNLEKSNARINELQTKFDTHEKEKQIELLNKDKEINKAELNRQRAISTAVSVGLVLLITLLYFIYKGLKEKKRANAELQEANQLIREKNEIVEEKNKEILDSIHYAQKIQQALLASNKVLSDNLKEYMLLYRPKDIVSGDFYWAKREGDLYFLCVADSTGHGVPGAFMSLLNISYLNEAVSERSLTEPGAILDHVRQRLISHISQEGQKDGMDCILICINLRNHSISYSAAHNAPVVVSQNGFHEHGCDKMPVGAGERMEPFQTYQLELKEGEILYLYTDGFADQFGGPKGKKFKYKPLNELLTKICRENMQEQKKILSDTFEEWKGKLEQVDDVCIIGLRL